MNFVSSTSGKPYALHTCKRVVLDSGVLKANFSVFVVISDTLTLSGHVRMGNTSVFLSFQMDLTAVIKEKVCNFGFFSRVDFLVSLWSKLSSTR